MTKLDSKGPSIGLKVNRPFKHMFTFWRENSNLTINLGWCRIDELSATGNESRKNHYLYKTDSLTDLITGQTIMSKNLTE